jgi:hypothetical protein
MAYVMQPLSGYFVPTPRIVHGSVTTAIMAAVQDTIGKTPDHAELNEGGTLTLTGLSARENGRWRWSNEGTHQHDIVLRRSNVRVAQLLWFCEE